MPRHKGHNHRGPLLEHPVARAVYAELVGYCKDSQFIPVKNALFNYMRRDVGTDGKYVPANDITIGEFNHWFDRLCKGDWNRVERRYVPFILIDGDTRAIRPIIIRLVENDTPATEIEVA